MGFAHFALLLLLGVATASAQQAATGRSFAGTPIFYYDADGAAGPAHYAEITNASFRVTSLATGAVVYSSTTLSQFWTAKVGLPSLGCCFDPQLEYDHASGRWIAVSLSSAFQASSAIYVGISETSDPSGNWKGLVIDADPSKLRWADLQHLGVDGAGVYIRSGLLGIDATTPTRLGVFVLPKIDLLAATPTSARMSRFLTMYPPATNAYYYLRTHKSITLEPQRMASMFRLTASPHLF